MGWQLRSSLEKVSFLFPLLIILSFWFSHRNHLQLGPRGVHVWRQCNTLAVAKNFHEEEMNIMRPRVDHRKGQTGVTGTAFPAFEFALAAQYQVIGFTENGHRWLQFCMTALLILGAFYLGLLIFPDSIFPGVVMSWFMAWTPEVYYHGINALPDILALCATVWALCLYWSDRKSGSAIKLIGMTALFALAGLVKLQYLMFPGVVFLDQWFRSDGRSKAGIYLGLAISAIFPAIWYVYAINLRSTSELKDYGLYLNPADSWSETIAILWSNVVSDLPEQLIGYAFLPLVIFSLVKLYLNRSKLQINKWLCVLIGLIAYHLIELDQMKDHAYYMMPYLVFLVILIGHGVHEIMILKSLNNNRKWLTLLIAIGMLQPLITRARIDHRFESAEHSQLPAEFQTVDKLDSMRVIVNGSQRVALAPDLSGCIYFYFLRCKGYSFPSTDSTAWKSMTDLLYDQKVDWLVVNGLPTETEMPPNRVFRKIGNFYFINAQSMNNEGSP